MLRGVWRVLRGVWRVLGVFGVCLGCLVYDAVEAWHCTTMRRCSGTSKKTRALPANVNSATTRLPIWMNVRRCYVRMHNRKSVDIIRWGYLLYYYNIAKMPTHTRRRTTRRATHKRVGGATSDEDRLVDKFRKELQRLHKSHNPKNKETFCSKLKAYAQVVQLDGKTTEFQAAQKLRKMASRAVQKEWKDSVLKPNDAPLDAICEAIWNDTSLDGEAFFDKKRVFGLMNLVAALATNAGIQSLGLVAGSYLGNRIDPGSKLSQGTKYGGLGGWLAGIIGGTALFPLFTTEKGISANIRKHLKKTHPFTLTAQHSVRVNGLRSHLHPCIHARVSTFLSFFWRLTRGCASRHTHRGCT